MIPHLLTGFFVAVLLGFTVYLVDLLVLPWLRTREAQTRAGVRKEAR